MNTLQDIQNQLSNLSVKHKTLTETLKTQLENRKKGNTIEDGANWIETHLALEEIEKPVNAFLDATIRLNITKALTEGRLKPLPENNVVPFANRWNRLLEQPEVIDIFVGKDVIETLRKVIVQKWNLWETGGEDLNERLENGNTEHPQSAPTDLLDSHWDGGKTALRLDGWQPSLYHKRRHNTRGWTPYKDPAPNLLHATCVNIPKGRVFVADMPRFPAFQKRMAQMRSYNVNLGLHRIVRSTVLMGEHNIVQIAAGDSGAEVHRISPQTLIVGRWPDETTREASVSTEIWTVTVVGEQTLLDMGCTSEEIEDALACEDMSVLNLEPGTWWVFWSETMDPEALTAALTPHIVKEKSVSSQQAETLFVMTQNPKPFFGMDNVHIHSFDRRTMEAMLVHLEQNKEKTLNT